jgi:GAF domain-containing protein
VLGGYHVFTVGRGVPQRHQSEGEHVQPIAQSIETADACNERQPEVDVLGHLRPMADRVQQVVPEVIGMSIAWLDHGVAFTLVATDEEIAALDAVQYLVGGPCVTSVEREESLRAAGADLLDEDSWHLFAHTLAATSVRSTLTLLLTNGGATVGSVNLYAATDDAFDGHHGRLAGILGADVSTVIRNADLSFSTRATAERTPAANARRTPSTPLRGCWLPPCASTSAKRSNA